VVKALVTGGAGFIGSHLVDLLVRRGWEVTSYDRTHGSNLKWALEHGAEAVIGDVRAVDAMHGNYDVIFHLAALTGVQASVLDPIGVSEVNVLGTIAALDLARQNNARFVLASTAAVYGDPHQVPTPEWSPLKPDSPYGASKVAAEAYAGLYRNSVALRLADVFGPRQRPHGAEGVVAIFASRAAADESVVAHGDGLQTRDYVYVDDVADAFFRAATLGEGAYNIGTGRQTSVLDIAHLLKADVTTDPVKPEGVRRSCLSPHAAYSDLGWEAFTPLDVGLDWTLEWWS
jgi:UDP-glucose 4-epimerase